MADKKNPAAQALANRRWGKHTKAYRQAELARVRSFRRQPKPQSESPSEDPTKPAVIPS